MRNNITRREALRLSGMALAGAALPLVGCAQQKNAAIADANVQADNSPTADRSDIPEDAIGDQITEASSIAEAPSEDVEIDAPTVKPTYDVVDCHLHYCDFLEKTDGFPALAKAQDMSGVSESVIFGMGIAKQWDEHVDKAPKYYLSNDCRCYYYSATDFLLAEDLLAQPVEIRRRYHPMCCGINGNDRFAADHIRQLLKVYPNF